MIERLALLGNPNTGKSTVFNLLTGLRQKTGNFTGVTVEKKVGVVALSKGSVDLIDFPGTYSLYPRNNEEKIVFQSLKFAGNPGQPQAFVVVVDLSNLERNLLLFDQLYDLGLPIILVLNMPDKLARTQDEFHLDQLQADYPRAKMVEMNSRIGLGKDRLMNAIESLCHTESTLPNWEKVNESIEAQKVEIEQRLTKIHSRISIYITKKTEFGQRKGYSFDRIALHPVLGFLLFLVVLLAIFQSVFALATYPMEAIDQGFSQLAGWLHHLLPSGMMTSLLADGIVAGLGGILIFVPQIALLFFFLALMEETGYTSRVIFLMDRWMKPLGLNGRSVVPLLSSWACAVPGIMAARMITNRKERLITILVAPLMSCSARIPVFTLLIAVVIPQKLVSGVFQLQGLVLLALYVLGVFSAMLMAFLLHRTMKNKERRFLLLEMPQYHWPHWSNVGILIWNKTKDFVWGAGKIILIISIILWFLANFGPQGKIDYASSNHESPIEHSFLGYIGEGIEPVIQPLGYDWKIGIALISSFAAREVFVGTLSTIYAVESEDGDNTRLVEVMARQKNSEGAKVYTLATGVSLLLFYTYAMQCMATFAVVRKETGSWKWAWGQLLLFTSVAYIVSFIAYQWLT